METNKFDKDFWDNKYQLNKLGWDMGAVSPPLKEYIDQIQDRDISILLPGAGNSYEAEYLHTHGFCNVDVLDISKKPLENLKSRVKDFPTSSLIHADFFDWNKSYDLIIEQTFFCALDPSLRTKYAVKVNSLLKPNGKLVGLLFDFPLTEAGPPFGGSKAEYLKTFDPRFEIKTLEPCYNSINPRLGNELFIIFEKKFDLHE